MNHVQDVGCSETESTRNAFGVPHIIYDEKKRFSSIYG